eukprot:snap_masked-scaffold_7-processed-gene-6.28-mRNA-1 protein AED:1.00 eAED:1.00 QI:0/0/0/0/1/1/2/0/313
MEFSAVAHDMLSLGPIFPPDSLQIWPTPTDSVVETKSAVTDQEGVQKPRERSEYVGPDTSKFVLRKVLERSKIGVEDVKKLQKINTLLHTLEDGHYLSIYENSRYEREYFIQEASRLNDFDLRFQLVESESVENIMLLLLVMKTVETTDSYNVLYNWVEETLCSKTNKTFTEDFVYFYNSLDTLDKEISIKIKKEYKKLFNNANSRSSLWISFSKLFKKYPKNKRYVEILDRVQKRILIEQDIKKKNEAEMKKLTQCTAVKTPKKRKRKVEETPRLPKRPRGRPRKYIDKPPKEKPYYGVSTLVTQYFGEEPN